MSIREQRVAIIGAGIGGLSCATQLKADGFRVRVFDKGRGVGGRLSVRRGEKNSVFDHGAQYFTVKDTRMAEHVKQWIATEIVAPWEGQIGSLHLGQWTPTSSETVRYVGVPGMTAIAKHLATELDVILQCRVASIAREIGGWRLTSEDGRDLGEYDFLVLNAPAPQSADLLKNFDKFASKIHGAAFAPCWAVMLAFEQRLVVSWDAAFVEDSPLSWIARNSSKPGRPDKLDCWVLHANPEWSTKHLEESDQWVTSELLKSFWQSIKLQPQKHVLASSHRWRFALPTQPLQEKYLFDDELSLGACGDWCGGPRVEGAYLSGNSLAEKIRLTLAE